MPSTVLLMYWCPCVARAGVRLRPTRFSQPRARGGTTASRDTLMRRVCVHFYKNCSYRKVRLLRIVQRLQEQVLPFLLLIKLRTRANLLHTLRGAGFTKGMSGVGQDLYDDPIELLLTLASTLHIIASASLQCRVKREPACLTEQNKCREILHLK